MEIETILDPVDNAFHAQIGLSQGVKAMTPAEKEAWAELGEPLIQCGGEFISGQVTFTIPTNPRRFPSQFPAKVIFDSEDYDNAQQMAGIWLSAVQSQIVFAKDTLISTSITGIGRTIATI